MLPKALLTPKTPRDRLHLLLVPLPLRFLWEWFPGFRIPTFDFGAVSEFWGVLKLRFQSFGASTASGLMWDLGLYVGLGGSNRPGC